MDAIPIVFLSDSLLPELALNSILSVRRHVSVAGRCSPFVSHFVQIKSERDPGPTVENQIDSDKKTNRIKTGDRPLHEEEDAQDRCDDSVQGVPTPARQMHPHRGHQLIHTGDEKEHRHQKSQSFGAYQRSRQHRYADDSEEDRGQQVQEEPAQFPTMNASTNSMMPAITSSHPKKPIETTVLVTDREIAAMPSNIRTMPNAKNHPQL
jgi:hypothetical protein